MAKDAFHARLQRIQAAHADLEPIATTSVRELRTGGMTRTRARSRRKHPAWEHLVSIAFGIVLGCLAAVALAGLTLEASPWGPGTDLNAIIYYPALAGLGLAPVLIILSLFIAGKRPGFALFSLGYLTGMTVSLFV